VDGGAGFIGERHVRLSPVDKELLVQVNVQDNVALDIGTGGAVNMNVTLDPFNADAVMQSVAQFYCHPTKGAGIDLYWVKRDFVPLQGPQITGTTMSRTNAYRYTGDMVYTPKQGAQVTGDLNGSTWISSDTEYKATVPTPTYREIFPAANGMFEFMMGQNRDMKMPGFVLLLLTSRHAWVDRENNNAPYKVYPQLSNAFTILEGNTPIKQRQGSVVNIVGVSEERPFDTGISDVTHYSDVEFLDIVGYCIAHELFHLLCGLNHTMTQNTVFGLGPYLSTLEATPSNELIQINLKARRGVTE